MRLSTKRAVSSIKAETPPVVEPPLATNGESILNSEKSALKANGVQEGSESVPLFAPSSHVGDKFSWTE
jgi:hypothetical protein